MKRFKILFVSIVTITMLSTGFSNFIAKASDSTGIMATTTVSNSSKYTYEELKQIQTDLLNVQNKLNINGTGINQLENKLRIYVNILDKTPVNTDLLYQYIDKDAVEFIEEKGVPVDDVATEEQQTNDGIIKDATDTIEENEDNSIATATINNSSEYTYEELKQIQKELLSIHNELNINGTGINSLENKLRIYVNILDEKPVNTELLYQYIDKDAVEFIEEKGVPVDDSESTDDSNQSTKTSDNASVITIILSCISMITSKKILKCKRG